MAIRGHAWKTTHEKNATTCFYRMQVNGISGAREENRVIKAMDGWVDAGEGYNAKTGLTTLYFRRDFGSVENFIKWGKGFQAFPIDEVDQDGKVKKYVKIGPRGSSGRVCGKCGGSGHNQRTCGKQDSQVSAKKGTRKCSICNQPGHNSRACKSAAAAVAQVKHDMLGLGCADCRYTGLNCENCGTKKVKGKRQCSKCKGYGHNSRTCGKKTDSKPSPEGKYKCGKCGKVGHNRRRCPN